MLTILNQKFYAHKTAEENEKILTGIYDIQWTLLSQSRFYLALIFFAITIFEHPFFSIPLSFLLRLITISWAFTVNIQWWLLERYYIFLLFDKSRIMFGMWTEQHGMIIETQEEMLLLTVSLLRSPVKCGWMLEIAILHWVFENHTHSYTHAYIHAQKWARTDTNKQAVRQATRQPGQVVRKRKKKNNTYHKLIWRKSKNRRQRSRDEKIKQNGFDLIE